jgi:hypothetical protein
VRLSEENGLENYISSVVSTASRQSDREVNVGCLLPHGGWLSAVVFNLAVLKTTHGDLTEFLLCNIYKSSPYLTGNTLRLRYKAQPVNAVWGNSRCLL